MRTAYLAFVFLASCILPATAKPNIVFILADDLGYGEPGCYGQKKIKTPNIDQLARDGIRFTRHYTGAPVCAPARCVLMTGRHLGNAEIRNNGDSGKGGPFPGQRPITAEALTIAEVLKKAGYATGGFGKWGLGPTDGDGSPIKQGFDRFYGYNCQRNAHSFFPPFLDDDEGIETINQNPIPGHQKKPEGEVKADDYRAETYAPDRILEEALEFLDKNKDGPFFLYCPFVEPHVAMHPPQEWLDRYPEEWDKEKGVYRGQNGYLPHPRPRAGYASMISDLDEHVGAVLKRLDDHGLRDNTIVIFTSDNGTTHGSRDPLFGVGGVDAAFFNSTAGLRGFKGSVHEGGIRVPGIVRWPGVVTAGTTTDVPSYFPDWFPTLCTVAGTPAPKDLDGIDLSAALKGETPERPDPMIWEFHGYGGQLAVIDGDWKAVRLEVRSKKGPGEWELYNLKRDPAETTDLARKMPAILKNVFLHNLTKEFPWEDASVDVVYSSHTLEHMTKAQGRQFLRECHRILRPGGLIRIVVPDLRRLVDMYLREEIPADDFLTSLDVLYNSGNGRIKDRLAPFVEFPHKCMYDTTRLLEIIRETGFEAEPKEPFESEIEGIEKIELESRTRGVNAVIVEGRKT